MIIKTGRFGQLTIGDEERIHIPQGILGFPEYTDFCLVDSGDDTLILWLQAIRNPEVAFPVLEPKIFRPDYRVSLSAADMRELHLKDLKNAAVFSVLNIPENVEHMTANLKAPLVVNLMNQKAKQVVLQENEYSIKQSLFKELRAHLMTIQAQKQRGVDQEEPISGPVPVRTLPPSPGLNAL